jgi:acyl transferase domain-containing protein
VKTNLGHAEAASGIIGIMKTVLSLERGMIPASVGIQNLNPNSKFDISRRRMLL